MREARRVTLESAAAFGRTVRRRRREQGISQEELADRAGLHRTFISMIERGVRNPSLDVVYKLADALETTAAALVGEADAQR